MAFSFGTWGGLAGSLAGSWTGSLAGSFLLNQDLMELITFSGRKQSILGEGGVPIAEPDQVLTEGHPSQPPYIRSNSSSDPSLAHLGKPHPVF